MQFLLACKAQCACVQLWPTLGAVISIQPAGQHCQAHEETPQSWHAPVVTACHLLLHHMLPKKLIGARQQAWWRPQILSSSLMAFSPCATCFCPCGSRFIGKESGVIHDSMRYKARLALTMEGAMIYSAGQAAVEAVQNKFGRSILQQLS